jgi:hypothetical protein
VRGGRKQNCVAACVFIRYDELIGWKISTRLSASVFDASAEPKLNHGDEILDCDVS